MGAFCSRHLLKVNSSARGLIFALDGSECSSSHPVCLICGKELLVPSEKEVLGLRAIVGGFAKRKPSLYLLGIEFKRHSHVAFSLITLSPLTARSKCISFPILRCVIPVVCRINQTVMCFIYRQYFTLSLLDLAHRVLYTTTLTIGTYCYVSHSRHSYK